MAASGRNPAQKTSRVSRAPGMPKVKPLGKASPDPVNARADLAENRAPRRGAGLTRAGGNTPVPARGRSVPPVTPAIRDLSSSATGMTIAQRANSTGRARKAAG